LLISRVFAFALNSIAGYRKNVIEENLKQSFHDFSKSKISTLKNQYYKHFTEVVFEILKSASISKTDSQKALTLGNKSLIDDLFKKHDTIIVSTAHTGNWETPLTILPLLFKEKVYTLYKPLSNKTFDDLVFKIRSRFGLKLLPAKTSTKVLLKKENQKRLVVYIADQTPFPENAIWTDFLNRSTPFFKGPEKIGTKINCPIVYAESTKDGFYNFGFNFKLITESPSSCKPDEITKIFANCLENQIKDNPVSWMWSHRRWKHKPKVVTGVN